MTSTDILGVAERNDIVIDFTQWSVGSKVQMVNLAEHDNGKLVSKVLSLGEALSGNSPDLGVGAFLEFRIVREPGKPDLS